MVLNVVCAVQVDVVLEITAVKDRCHVGNVILVSQVKYLIFLHKIIAY